LISAALIHFYLFSAVALFYTADFIDRYRNLKTAQNPTKAGMIFLASVLIISICVWQAGYFAISLRSSSPGGYGDDPINLLTLFDAKGWSYFFHGWSTYNYFSSDDLNFLGMGLILLIPFAMIGIYQIRTHIQLFVYQHLFAVLCLLALTLFAISHQVHIGKYLWHFSLPGPLLNFAGVLRGSARMFWLVYYVIAVLIIYGAIKGVPKKGLLSLLVVSSFLQIADTSAGWLSRKAALAAGTNSKVGKVYSGDFWDEAGAKYHAIVKILTQDNVAINWYAIAKYALRFNLPTNSVYLARTDSINFKLFNVELEAMLLSGAYSPNFLYFIDPNKVIPALVHLKQGDLLMELDGATVLAPGWRQCTSCKQPVQGTLLESLIPHAKVGAQFNFNRTTTYGLSPYILNFGWGFPENWGTWSSGPQAQMTLPLPVDANSLTLTTRALVSPTYPQQNIQILVNDSFKKEFRLTQGDQNTILIPINEKIKRDGYVQIWFIFENAIRPSSIDLGTDDRQLAIGLISGKFE